MRPGAAENGPWDNAPCRLGTLLLWRSEQRAPSLSWRCYGRSGAVILILDWMALLSVVKITPENIAVLLLGLSNDYDGVRPDDLVSLAGGKQDRNERKAARHSSDLPPSLQAPSYCCSLLETPRSMAKLGAKPRN